MADCHGPKTSAEDLATKVVSINDITELSPLVNKSISGR